MSNTDQFYKCYFPFMLANDVFFIKNIRKVYLTPKYVAKVYFQSYIDFSRQRNCWACNRLFWLHLNMLGCWGCWINSPRWSLSFGSFRRLTNSFILKSLHKRLLLKESFTTEHPHGWIFRQFFVQCNGCRFNRSVTSLAMVYCGRDSISILKSKILHTRKFECYLWNHTSYQKHR